MPSLKSAAKLHENVPPDWYETSVKTNLLQRYWHKRRFQAVGLYSEKVKGEVLDIGSADGYFSQEILRLTGASALEGIDVLKSSVAYANERYKTNTKLHFALGDGHKLEYKDKSFAAVYCLEAMEHVHNPDTVVGEIYRVLKPGGYCLVLVPAENLLFKCVWFVWTKWRGKIWKDTHLHHFDHTKLESIMKSKGFVSVTSHRFLLGMLLLVKARRSN